MDKVLEKANKKFIDHITVLNDMYNRFDEDLFDSEEFKKITTVSDSNPVEDVLMFYFALGYELQEWNPETIEDPTNGKIAEIIDAVGSLSCTLKDQKQLKAFTLYLLHNYFVMDSMGLWVKYALEHNKIGSDLKKAMNFSFENMRLALMNLSEVTDTKNFVFQYLKEAEYERAFKILNAYLMDGRTPDISAIYIFADQLDNPDWFKGLANIVYKEVSTRVATLIKESNNKLSGLPPLKISSEE